MPNMEINRTRVAHGGKGKGYVMFGKESSGKWFQRWFPTLEAAKTHAKKKNWRTTYIPVAGGYGSRITVRKG
jgi:hypothetical protein